MNFRYLSFGHFDNEIDFKKENSLTLRKLAHAIHKVCLFLSHLLIAGCDIGVQISVRPFVRSFVRSSVRPSVCPSTFTSKFGFLDIRDSCESETLHSNCP